MACIRLRVLTAQVWAHGLDTETSPDEYEVATPNEVCPVIDPETNGMYASRAHRRSSSFTVEGAKFPGTAWPHRVMLVVSTPASNVCSRVGGAQAFLEMEVWESWGQGHTRAGRRGMGTTPGGLDECLYKGTVAEVFYNLKADFHGMTRLEDIFECAGIAEYTFFVCGYHINGARASVGDGQFCALDWYAQSHLDRA